MTERTELFLKLALCLVALAALAWRLRRSNSRREERGAGILLTVLAVIGLAAGLANFFTFHSGQFVHFQDMFHYQLGSKYFPELGYDGLYEASVAAQVEGSPSLPLPGTIRNLATNEIVPASAAIAQRSRAIARFSPARWRSFVADHAYFAEAVAVSFPDTRIDHGYNPTPFWTFVGRVFSSWMPLNATTVPLLALLDWALIGTALVFVHRTYGAGAAATLAILFGLGYPWRYVWVGGSFLRFDWLAAVVIGVCLLKRGGYAAAGALFAYATAVRIFPVLLLAGVAAVAVRELVLRRDARWILRFGGAFAGGLAFCVLAGALGGRGPGAWGEFATNIKKHNETWALNTAGLELAFVYPPSIMLGRPAGWPLARDERYEATVDSAPGGGVIMALPALGVSERAGSLDEARVAAEIAIARTGDLWQTHMVRAQAEGRPYFLIAALLAFAALMLAAWQRPLDEAVVIGVIGVFALLHLSGYYWVLLCLMALRRDRIGAAGSIGLLALNALTFAAALSTPVLQILYLGFTWGLVALFTAWIGPDVLATLRRRKTPAPVEAPASKGRGPV
jgi:hypothetical protein